MRPGRLRIWPWRYIALEFYPEHRAVLAAACRDLGRRYGEPLLAELRSAPAAVAEEDLWAANNLGFGIVNVFDPEHDPVEELELGIVLLSEAKERADPEAQAEAYGYPQQPRARLWDARWPQAARRAARPASPRGGAVREDG